MSYLRQRSQGKGIAFLDAKARIKRGEKLPIYVVYNICEKSYYACSGIDDPFIEHIIESFGEERACECMDCKPTTKSSEELAKELQDITTNLQSARVKK